MKISFFENIFYWIWTSAPKRGIPERAFGIISILQFTYLMFFIVLILHTLNEEMIVALYNIDTRITIVPLGFIYAILFWVHMKIYDEKRYLTLKEKYARMNETEKKKTKKTFKNHMLVSILVGILTVWLWSDYADKVKQVVNPPELNWRNNIKE
jgi:predicted histidine transporter YuiF (NhaC family)